MRDYRCTRNPRETSIIAVRQFRIIMCALFVWLVALPVLHAAGVDAEHLAKEAAKAEKAGQIVQAYLLYAEAAAASPKNMLYWSHAQALRPLAELTSKQQLPILAEPFDRRGPPESKNSGGLSQKDLEDLDRMKDVPRLKPVPGTKSFDLKGDAKTLFEQIAPQYGYTTIFDKDYNAPATVRFVISDVDYISALHALEEATNSFIVPLSDRVMLVAQDTPQKRIELEANEAMAIPIPQRTSVPEAQELLQLIQQALEIRRIVLDPVKRLIFVRDRASKVQLASAILSQLSGGKAQVAVDIDFLQVGRSSSMSLGFNLPTSFPLVDFGKVLNSTPSIPAGFMKFLTFGAGKTFMGIGITDAQMFATSARTQASSLMKAELTSSDGQPASMHVGNKYPIVTGAYLGVGGLQAGSGTTYAVISTASYADVSTTTISSTGNMKLVVNGNSFPFTIPAGANSLIGVENIINSIGAGIGAETITRGTTDRPYSLLIVASTLGITSVQLFDDPDGANISLLKKPDQISAISVSTYPDTTTTKVSSTGVLSLTVGTNKFALSLADTTNNLNGLRDAINQSGASLTAAVLTTGILPNPYFLVVVANDPNTGEIQVFDDPSGVNAPLLAPTDELNQTSTLGQRVSTGTNSNNLGQAYAPPPTFNFEDLGLVLKVTPFVHNLDEVTLEVEAEFKVLGSGSYNGVPVISTRKFQGKVRLKTSEYAVVAGLVTESEARTLTGLAGLMNLPLVGPLFRQTTTSKDTSQVLIVIKPRVTSMPTSEFIPKAFWFGSETKPMTIL
jgi:general secretion pathway protein D